MNKFKVGDVVYTTVNDKPWKVVEINSGIDYNEYLCYQKGFGGHCGDYGSIKSKNTGTGYDTSEYWFFREENLKLYQDDYPVICITTDGKTTTAQKRLNGKILKEASVKLYCRDTFDFDIGCEEALKKLNSSPHLKWKHGGENIGEIGKPTNQTGIFGEELYIGDTVEVFDTHSRRLLTPLLMVADTIVSAIGFRGIEFHDGLAENGKFQLRKIKSYKDLQNGEIIGSVEVVK